MQIFTSEHRHQFMELMREFEAQKRGDPGHIHLRLPSKLMKIYSKENDKNEVNIQIDAERKFHIDEELDRINISEKLFKDLFQETLEAVKACLNRVFENDDCKDIETIIAVGGLSESLFVRNLLEDHFPTKKLYVPSESDLAVLKGAVEFGMDPDIITSRICRYSYGIKIFKDFEEGVHPTEKRVNRDGAVKCKDCFSIKLKKGEKVKVNHTTTVRVYDTFNTAERESSRFDPLRIDIYRSTEKEPKFTTDEGCQKLCQLIIPPPKGKWPTRAEANVHLNVARTELVAFHYDGDLKRSVGIDFM
ncbi:hypothetical protein FSP39_010687 [Pinctada imbricata]|uniref:Uncharacterized protein n=1 Tax=Pinctada imbricata TaxID=66713 RepID=A0AA89C8Q9_PINIB|nr:hypothetical protein FSP39_010687 [Pinctada imbricata]